MDISDFSSLIIAIVIAFFGFIINLIKEAAKKGLNRQHNHHHHQLSQNQNYDDGYTQNTVEYGQPRLYQQSQHEGYETNFGNQIETGEYLIRNIKLPVEEGTRSTTDIKNDIIENKSSKLKSILGDKDSIRRAIVLGEILQPKF